MINSYLGLGPEYQFSLEPTNISIKNAPSKIQSMTSIKLLHVSAMSAILRESPRTNEFKPNTLN